MVLAATGTSSPSTEMPRGCTLYGMKISLKEAAFFDRADFTGNVYVGKEKAKGFNALFVTCITRHYKTKLQGAARAYLVLEGSGTFTIDGKKEPAEQYDFFLISDGQIYEYEGSMKLFEFNVPATDSGNEEKME
jgi:hypothetical protein